MLPQIDKKALPFTVLGVAAQSGTGKTTLLKALIPRLKQRGLRLGLIKHTHHCIRFDNMALTRDAFAEKANVIAVSSTLSMAKWHQQNSDTALQDAIDAYRDLPIDLLLIEGFKAAAFPKLEIHRKALNHPLLALSDPNIVVIASDDAVNVAGQTNACVIPLQAHDKVADWVVKFTQKIRDDGINRLQ